MEKELHKHPFSLSPSICQPFVLSASKEAVGTQDRLVDDCPHTVR